MSSSKAKAKKSEPQKIKETRARRLPWIPILAVVAVLVTVGLIVLLSQQDHSKIDLEKARTALEKAIKESRPQRRLSLAEQAKRQTQGFSQASSSNRPTAELLWNAAQLLEQSVTQELLPTLERESLATTANRITLTEIETNDLLTATLICAQVNEVDLGLQLANVLIQRKQPRDEILKAVAMMQFQAGRYDAVIETCQELTHSFPKDPMAWEMLVSIYEGRGYRLQLLEIYPVLMELMPAARNHYRNRLIQRLVEVGNLTQARQQYNKLQHETSTPNLLLEARLLLLEGHVDEALDRLTTVLNEEPQNSLALVLAGRIYQAQGQNSEAVEVLSRALKITPRNQEIHYLLSQVYLILDQAELSQTHARIHEQLQSNQKRGEQND